MTTTTEKLGIQIDVPFSLQDAAELRGELPISYKILTASSFLFLFFGIVMLASDIFNWPLQDFLYNFLIRLVP